MNVLRRSAAGGYARERYRRGLKAYRRRMRTPLLVVVTPLFAFFVVVAGFHHLDPWSVAAGVAVTMGVALISFVRDEPPHNVAAWGRGANGERKTEKALRPLERKGWRIEHDIQQNGRANLDHVAIGPPGVFLLETKNLSGAVAFEDGVLTVRAFDDPDNVYRHTRLAPRLRGQAKELSARRRAETGRGEWVTAAVVIWGHFPAGHVEHENITYIAGERLAKWLTAFPARTLPVFTAHA